MALKTNALQWRLCIMVLFVALVQQAQGQTPTPSPETDYFAPLKDLEKPAPHGLSNQNFTRCCLRALDSWRKDPKNSDIIVESSKNPFHAFQSVDELSKTKTVEQFPCGAEYDDKSEDKDGATRVMISYAWCKSNCGGWQRSRSAVLEQWVQPFVGFILPAAVFCLNVPRKTVINIPDDLFMDLTKAVTKKWNNFIKAKGIKASVFRTFLLFAVFLGETILVATTFLIGALFAAAIGFSNVVVWVIVVFSTAAPMILSGLYEATIDRQILRAIEKEILKFKSSENTDKNNPHQVRHQIHMLYAVLVGNLELRKKGKKPVTDGSNQTSTPNQEASLTPSVEDADCDLGKAWVSVEDLMRDLDPVKQPKKYEKEHETTARQLKAMLATQASFGASIGAPIAFYLGSFLFSVFGNHSKLGDIDVSLSLAFGEWWMTIPHVAIVSGCLLAGNNPNTLGAIVSGVEGREDPSKNGDIPKEVDPLKEEVNLKNGEPSKENELSKDKDGPKPELVQGQNGFLTSFYQSVYQPVWMWERGRNKRNWFKQVQRTYSKRQVSKDAEPKVIEPHVTEPKDNPRKGWRKLWRFRLTTPDFIKVPIVGSLQWAFLLLTASILIVVPFVLAYVTSYYTPIIGLSCRTFTFVLYFIFQSMLTLTWLYDFRKKDDRAPKSIWFLFLAYFFFVGSSFTAIIGTFMQILGVYRNCLCNIPMPHWSSRDFHFTVSTNSAEAIYYAELYWLSTGIGSICLLVIFCYFGWWYQRHWRRRFDMVVDSVLDVPPHASVKDDFKRRKAAREKRRAESTNDPEQPGQNSKAHTPAPSMRNAGNEEEFHKIEKMPGEKK